MDKYNKRKGRMDKNIQRYRYKCKKIRTNNAHCTLYTVQLYLYILQGYPQRMRIQRRLYKI